MSWLQSYNLHRKVISQSFQYFRVSLLGCQPTKWHSTDSESPTSPPKKNIVRKKVSIPPAGKFDTPEEEKKDDGKPDPYAPFPDNTNPTTGEIGGPTGPEPTRYGDWERKGRVTDF